MVIPPRFQHVLLKELHNEHSGISQTKSFARSYMWWPNMDICIEEMISGGLICQSARNNTPAAPLHPWPWVTPILQRFHIDFAEKSEHNYLIAVDSHSKWLEVIPMKTTTSEKTIDVVRKLFSSHGLCEEQLVSHVFKSFCEANGIKHTRVVPYHPQSNGAAERCVQTVKNSLKKYTKSHGISHDHCLANFLLRYRCTPHSVTGVTPCQLFLKRNKFSLLKPSLEREMEEKQHKQQRRSENVKLRELRSGDTVHVRNHLYGQVKWPPGTVVCRLGPLKYLIQVHGKHWYVHIRSTSEVDESVISDPVLPYHNKPSVVPNSMPNPIVTPISENIENCESTTVVEQGIPNISPVKTPLRMSIRNINTPEKMDL